MQTKTFKTIMYDYHLALMLAAFGTDWRQQGRELPSSYDGPAIRFNVIMEHALQALDQQGLETNYQAGLRAAPECKERQ